MATIYSRLSHFILLKQKPKLTVEQKAELGQIVCKAWFSQTALKYPITRVTVVEPEGTFTVLSYCKKFSPTIDRLISEYYHSLPQPIVKHPVKEKPKRKRIPVPAFKGNLKPISNDGTN